MNSQEQALRDVVASTEFEGGSPSAEAVQLAASVIAGEITADEAAERLTTVRGERSI